MGIGVQGTAETPYTVGVSFCKLLASWVTMSQLYAPATSWQKSGVSWGHHVPTAWFSVNDHTIFPVWDKICQVNFIDVGGLVTEVGTIKRTYRTSITGIQVFSLRGFESIGVSMMTLGPDCR